jgi:hypothetical protein
MIPTIYKAGRSSCVYCEVGSEVLKYYLDKYQGLTLTQPSQSIKIPIEIRKDPAQLLASRHNLTFNFPSLYLL